VFRYSMFVGPIMYKEVFTPQLVQSTRTWRRILKNNQSGMQFLRVKHSLSRTGALSNKKVMQNVPTIVETLCQSLLNKVSN
jgi:hypothetical protein